MDLISFSALKKMGVLGMNSRNIQFISRYNERRRYGLVDNKLQTKLAAEKAGVSVPPLLGVIENQWQLRGLNKLIGDMQRFVVKPNRGSGGKGIMVIVGRDFDFYIKSSGAKLELRQLRSHISNILSGLYSLGGKPDMAMIEAVIDYDAVFNDYTYEGVPDIRVILYRGYPVMAMLRCATHESDGRANLHQGAIGVGIDIHTGRSLRAVQRGNPVEIHPDTGKSFEALVIPDWHSILVLAAGCYEMTGLGYIGCDIVIDRDRGPVILELNARPGLAIQMANGAGLRRPLDHIGTFPAEAFELSPLERVTYLLEHTEPRLPMAATSD